MHPYSANGVPAYEGGYRTAEMWAVSHRAEDSAWVADLSPSVVHSRGVVVDIHEGFAANTAGPGPAPSSACHSFHQRTTCLRISGPARPPSHATPADSAPVGAIESSAGASASTARPKPHSGASGRVLQPSCASRL